MNLLSKLLTLFSCWLPLAQAAEPADPAAPAEPSPISVTVFDSHGFSGKSAGPNGLEFILFKPHTHLHVKIANTGPTPLVLWRPRCPQGDQALTLEFRDPASPDTVFQARPYIFYTGGSGVPKTFTLAAGDEVLVNVDLTGEWPLPFRMETGERRTWEARAVYRSAPLTPKEQEILRPSSLPPVWTGSSASPWQKTLLLNRTDAPIQPRK